jgi:hypothetical protein
MHCLSRAISGCWTAPKRSARAVRFGVDSDALARMVGDSRECEHPHQLQGDCAGGGACATHGVWVSSRRAGDHIGVIGRFDQQGR